MKMLQSHVSTNRIESHQMLQSVGYYYTKVGQIKICRNVPLYVRHHYPAKKSIPSMIQENKDDVLFEWENLHGPAHGLRNQIIVRETCQYVLYRSDYGSTWYGHITNSSVINISTVALGVRPYKCLF